MEINDYQKRAMATLNPELAWKDVLLNSVMGLCGESGETIDIVATCVPRVIGQVKDYIEGYQEPKEDWEE